jgi:hypothetical protein
MKAISIRQPWAYLVAAGIKDVESRSRPTDYRGPLLIIAVKKTPAPEDLWDAAQLCKRQGVTLPSIFEIGGIVGLAELVDCVTKSSSPWFNEGYYGHLLRQARPVPFIPYRGQLGLYDVEGYDYLWDQFPAPINIPRVGWINKIQAQFGRVLEVERHKSI